MKYNSKRIAYTTYIIIGLNLILYVIEIRLGGSTDISTLERLGALIPERVEAGEWWRLIGANFLHYGSLHLATNMLALYFIGRLVEFNLGARSYLIIYLASGIGSMLTFSWLAIETGMTNVFLVGASAAIMGLIGAVLAISLQLWLQNRNPLNNRRLRRVILIIIIQFIFDSLIPQISFQSHLFGLIIGFLVSSFLLLFKPKI
ncbi:rhomboid family intramembrane serine protease [Myxosarcina sp. GI1(2024)]